MHVLLYVDPFDVQRIRLLKKYLSGTDYFHLQSKHHVLHLFNTAGREEVHLSYKDNELADTHVNLSIKLSAREVCAVALSHIGHLHSQSSFVTFLQRFYLNGKEYSMDKDLQVHLRAYWEKIHKAPHIAIARAGSEPIRRLVLHAQENHEVFRVIEEGIKNA